MSVASYTVRVFRGHAGLVEIRQPWLDLISAIRDVSFYQHPGWFECFARSHGKAMDRLVFAVVYREARLIGVIPLEFNRHGKWLSYTEASVPVRGQLYHPDCLVDPAEDPVEVLDFALDGIASHTGCDWDILLLRNALETSLVARYSARSRYPCVSSPNATRCATLDVIPYEEAQKRMRRKFRKNLARSYRKLEELGGGAFFHHSDAEGLPALFEAFAELESKGWKGGHSAGRGDHPKAQAIALSASKLDFYRHAVRYFGDLGAVHIFVLRQGESCLAMQLCLVLGTRGYVLKTAYDEAFSRCSPGHLIQDFAYSHFAASTAVRQLNLISDSPADDGWCPEKTRFVTLRNVRLTLKGILLLAVLRVRSQLSGKTDRRSKVLDLS